MTQTATTSIRLPVTLKKDLEKAAHVLHRGKNWIIIQALEAYLKKTHYAALVEEARRQSLLAAKKSQSDEVAPWEENSDETGWE